MIEELEMNAIDGLTSRLELKTPRIANQFDSQKKHKDNRKQIKKTGKGARNDTQPQRIQWPV